MNQEISFLIRKFNDERDWDKFHSPKNLAISIAIESAELLEKFQWLSDTAELKEEDICEIKEEVADVFIYLITFADKLGIDIEESITNKIEKNSEKYPVDQAKGNSTKYNKL